MRIKESLFSAANHSDENLADDTSEEFDVRAHRFKKILDEIDIINKSLQTHGYTLADCRTDLDELIESIGNDRDNPSIAIYGCRLRTLHIEQLTAFKSDVVKIQLGKERELTRAEKRAVRILKEVGGNQQTVASSSAIVQGASISERLAKRRKLYSETDAYIDSKFFGLSFCC